MIKILYFASLRETLDCAQETFQITENETIESLIKKLQQRGESWKSVFSDASIPVLYAINQEMVKVETVIVNNDEVAFFPPVTGG